MRSQRLFSIRCAALLTLVSWASGAWAIEASPSPSYDGNYVVSWSTTLGCTYNDDPPFYSYYCFWLEEDGVPLYETGYARYVSGKPAGTYSYYIYYRMYVYGQPYDEGIVEGPTAVTVID
jgi:hypothetical protein